MAPVLPAWVTWLDLPAPGLDLGKCCGHEPRGVLSQKMEELFLSVTLSFKQRNLSKIRSKVCGLRCMGTHAEIFKDHILNVMKHVLTVEGKLQF